MLIGLFVYCYVCALLYAIMHYAYIANVAQVLPMPKWRWLYYLLSFTWGLPMNIIGGIVAIVQLCKGRRPRKYGWCWCFELPVNYGLDLGIFFIAPINGSAYIKNHELGHSIQNVHFGPFTIGVSFVPSAIRYQVRNMQKKRGRALPAYDDIWFEGQATKSGEKFMEDKQEKERD